MPSALTRNQKTFEIKTNFSASSIALSGEVSSYSVLFTALNFS